MLVVLAIALAAVLQPCGEARRPCSATALHPAILGGEAEGFSPGALHRRALLSSADCCGRFISTGARCTAWDQCRCCFCSARPLWRCRGLLDGRLRGGREDFSSDESEEVKRYGAKSRTEGAVAGSARRAATQSWDPGSTAQEQAHLSGAPPSITSSIPPDLGGSEHGQGAAPTGGVGVVVAEAASTQWDDTGGSRVGEAGEAEVHAGMKRAREEEPWVTAEAAGPASASKLEVSRMLETNMLAVKST